MLQNEQPLDYSTVIDLLQDLKTVSEDLPEGILRIQSGFHRRIREIRDQVDREPELRNCELVYNRLNKIKKIILRKRNRLSSNQIGSLTERIEKLKTWIKFTTVNPENIQDRVVIREGKVRKGGINEPPETEAPDPPKGQQCSEPRPNGEKQFVVSESDLKAFKDDIQKGLQLTHDIGWLLSYCYLEDMTEDQWNERNCKAYTFRNGMKSTLIRLKSLLGEM